MRSSGASPKGSALKRTVPIRCSGSCGTVMIRWRIVAREIFERLRESILTNPEDSSMVRKMLERSVLFPLHDFVSSSSPKKGIYIPASPSADGHCLARLNTERDIVQGSLCPVELKSVVVKSSD